MFNNNLEKFPMNHQQIIYLENSQILSLSCTLNEITAHLSDGRTISIPTIWYSRLKNATLEQLNDFEIEEDGLGIHWPQIDEDTSIKAFIFGPHSGC